MDYVPFVPSFFFFSFPDTFFFFLCIQIIVFFFFLHRHNAASLSFPPAEVMPVSVCLCGHISPQTHRYTKKKKHETQACIQLFEVEKREVRCAFKNTLFSVITTAREQLSKRIYFSSNVAASLSCFFFSVVCFPFSLLSLPFFFLQKLFTTVKYHLHSAVERRGSCGCFGALFRCGAFFSESAPQEATAFRLRTEKTLRTSGTVLLSREQQEKLR